MARGNQLARTWLTLLSDGGLLRLALDPRRTLRWLRVRATRSDRGVGPLRRAPRASCAVCPSPAPLVVGPAYADELDEAWQVPACRHHVERIAMTRLAQTERPVSAYPSRITWAVWWRSAPVAVAWRNAAERVPLSADDLVPATVSAPPLSARLFRQRPTLW